MIARLRGLSHVSNGWNLSFTGITLIPFYTKRINLIAISPLKKRVGTVLTGECSQNDTTAHVKPNKCPATETIGPLPAHPDLMLCERLYISLLCLFPAFITAKLFKITHVPIIKDIFAVGRGALRVPWYAQGVHATTQELQETKRFLTTKLFLEQRKHANFRLSCSTSRDSIAWQNNINQGLSTKYM